VRVAFGVGSYVSGWKENGAKGRMSIVSLGSGLGCCINSNAM